MPWLTVVIFLPLVGVPVLGLWRGASDLNARAVALVVSLATFLVVPQPRVGRFLLELTGSRARTVDVKGTPWLGADAGRVPRSAACGHSRGAV